MKTKAAGVIAVIFLALWWYLGTSLFELLLAGLVVLALLLRAAWWAFVPRTELPRNRVRCQRIRLYLRLHPGSGHATWWELHRHWSRTAAYRRVQRVRSS